MRIHNGHKPFKCDFADCDMSFTTQGHLTDHKRRHSGERPYHCEVCNDKFMRSSTLKIHMRRHTGEKPYKCDKCERAFSESGNLRTHLRIHVYLLGIIKNIFRTLMMVQVLLVKDLVEDLLIADSQAQ